MTDDIPPMPTRPPGTSRRRHALLLTAAIAVSVAIGAAGATLTADRTPSPTATQSSPPVQVDTPVAPASTEPVYDTLDASGFSIELRTLSRHCFGSAGCNIEVQPEITYLGDSDLIDPSAVYQITYEIRGDESGPVIETAELTSQTQLSLSQSLISTSSSGVKLSAEVTSVTEEGWS